MNGLVDSQQLLIFQRMNSLKNSKLFTGFLILVAIQLLVIVYSLLPSGLMSTGEKLVTNTSMILGCRYNPNALYLDKLYFNKDMSSVRWTSTNKSHKQTVTQVESMSENEFIIKGTKTVIDINKNKTEYPNSNLYVLKNWGTTQWNLYYFEDYPEDPVRMMVCNQL
jgi:hypothetical protein